METFINYGKRVAAIQEDEKSVTYEEIFRIADNMRNVISHRCLVFSFCRNTLGSLAGYVSFEINNIVPLLLSSELDCESRSHLIEVYQPEYLWIPNEMLGEFLQYEVVFAALDYSLLRTKLKGFPLYRELALLLTTSGSTGSPKLVRQSYKNIETNTNSIIEYLALTAEERPITTLPMNYTYGLSIINTHLSVGATILLTESTIMQKSFWDFFKKFDATSFGGVPYTYEMLNKLHFFTMDLPSLQTMTQAGGKLRPDLHRSFAEYAVNNKKQFVVMYGQTEATARMAYLPADKSLEKYGSMGIAIPGGSFKLWDTEKKEITQADITGELIYFGDNVTLGYAECGPDLCKGDERFGILETGDMAKMDADGFYYIVGRKKRFLKIYGNRVNLDELERIVCSEYLGYACACTGKDDKMYIFISGIDSINLSEIKKYVSEKTGLNKSAFKIIQIDQIPKNDAGKTLYRELERYCD